MKNIFYSVSFLVSLLAFQTVWAGPAGVVDIETMRSLKENMDTFFVGTTEIQKKIGNISEEDWKTILNSLGDMNRNILDMEIKDRKKIYHEYTGTLYEMTRVLKKLALKKDVTGFESRFEEMTDTCFKCHTTHRRPDGRKLKPKELGFNLKKESQS